MKGEPLLRGRTYSEVAEVGTMCGGEVDIQQSIMGGTTSYTEGPEGDEEFQKGSGGGEKFLKAETA